MRTETCTGCGGPVAPDPYGAYGLDGTPDLCAKCAVLGVWQLRMFRAKAGHPWADLEALGVSNFWAPPDDLDGMSDMERNCLHPHRRSECLTDYERNPSMGGRRL